MINLSERFPEIYRYIRQDAGRTRLVAGLITVNIVCAVMAFLTFTSPDKHWYEYCDILVFAQMTILFFYGTLCAAKTVTQERADRTWDFQRLTPLTSFEMATGKFLGGPLFAWFLFVTCVPWALLSAYLAPEITFGMLLKEYAVGISAALLLLSLGILVSAYDDFTSGRSSLAAGPLIGLFGVIMLVSIMNPLVLYHAHPDRGWRYTGDWSFFGYHLSGTVLLLFTVASLLAFAGWFFAGAKWRIGRDLLEKPVFGRLPAFLLFLCVYLLGILFADALDGQKVLPGIVVLPCAVVYLASFVSPEKAGDWKRWLAGAGIRERLDRTPVWVSGCATMIVIAGLFLLSMCFSPFVKYTGGSALLVLLPAFMLRDMCFLQWCRLTNSRRPEIMALTYIVLAYFMPLMVMGSLKNLDKYAYVFAPVPSADAGFAANIACAVLQALLMAFIMWNMMKSKLRESESPPVRK